MKYSSYLLLFPLILVCCGPPTFEKDTRVLVKGSVLDENNNPISDAEVNVYTRRSTSLFDSYGSSFLLGKDYTQQDGTFSVTSLFDRNEDFYIEIKNGDRFSNYIYTTNTEEYLPANLEFNLDTVFLRQLATFNYNITRTTSTQGTTLRFSFLLKNTSCFEVYDNGVLVTLQSSCYEDFTLGGSLNDVVPDLSSTYKTLLGTTIVFKYSLNNEPEITETFIIDKENYDFNFTY
ncbi:hypothetical protein [Mariniflexile sp.]|uniref:hypothetical protein n=1 Tax=Mariniflexile sp. TaxID=1979402 RepID=UPI0035669524